MTRHTKEYLRENSLAKLKPELLTEWNFEKNLMNPEDLSVGSNYTAFWICSVGHEFTQKVCHRTRINGLGCPFCAGRLGSNIAVGMPELFALWDHERNIDLDPYKLTAGSQKEAWFQCSAGHNYQRRIGTVRTAILRDRQPCPYCNKTLASDKYNLLIEYPRVAEEWDFEKNNSLPTQHLPSENKAKYWWRCASQHSYQMTINARTNQGSGCPYCAGQAVNSSNSLASTHPELIQEWSFEKNLKINPTDVTAGSNKKVWWRCSYGHEWSAQIYSRAKGKGCPKCSNQSSRPELRIFSEFELLFSKVEHRAKFGGQEYDILLRDIGVAVEFDGAFFHKDNKRDQNKNDAAKRALLKLIRVREWPLEKISIHDVVLGRDNELKKLHIDRLIRLIIGSSPQNAATEYLSMDKFQNDSRYAELISYLPGPLPGKSFAEHHPRLVNEWDFDKNLPLGPGDVSFGSNLEVSWKCKKGHKFDMSPKLRHQGQNCPFCSGRRVSIERSLGERYPNLVAEWDVEKNQNKTPYDYTYASHFKAWWICPKGHSYQAKISSRTRTPKGTGCKICFETRLGSSED